MARPVRTSIDEVSGMDDEFQVLLDRGAEQLARGDAESARETLARAADLRRDDPKTLGLLGQALYRLGRFDEAAALFGKLVEQNPQEAGAQVNLGLANLRAKRYVEAISHLERALDLNPEHRKAMGYLGLAWLEHGNVARAREWFSRGGSDHMVARCDELLQAARRSAPTPTDPQWTVATSARAAKAIEEHAAKSPEAKPAEEPAAKPVEEPAATPAQEPAAKSGDEPAREREASEGRVPPDDEAEIASAMRVLGEAAPAKDAAQAMRPWQEAATTRGSSGWKLAPITVVTAPARCTEPGPIPLPVVPRAGLSAQQGDAASDAAADPQLVPGDLALSAAEADIDVDVQPVLVETPPAPEAPQPPRPVTLEELASSGFPAVEPEGAPTFALDRGVLRIAVRGEVLSRVSRLVASRGAVDAAPETRRYRGRGTDKLFGDGRDAIHRVRGEGALLVRAGELRFTVVDLAASAGFFREDTVFAMEASIAFDNARLTARAGPDVDLVQLRGDGAFVLVTRGAIVAVDVSEAPLRIASSALVGWTGALTPRLTTLAEGSSGDTRAVELTGEGRVLLDSGTAEG